MRKILLSLATLALVGCGPFHRGPSGDATVVFNNQSLNQVDVFARATGTDPVRLGTVMSGQTSSLTIPSIVVGAGGQIAVIARVLAGPVVSSGPFSISAGETANLRLPTDGRSVVISSIH